ncbi:MAG: fibronectin type III domain-containing protein, partial [Bacteroidales bacterium]|nr:fibronectin type III domain-containing protein [Bacteroidales bacterium]
MKTNIRTWVIYILSLLSCIAAVTNLHSQDTVHMPVNSHMQKTVSKVIVYDDGGKQNNYSSSCNGSYTFVTSQPGNYFRISIHQNINSSNSNIAMLRICNGDTNSSNTVYICNTNQTVDYLYYSSKDTITIWFKSDDASPKEGFVIGLQEVYCPEKSVTCKFQDANTALLSWNGMGDADYYVIDYVDTTQVSYNCTPVYHVICDSTPYDKKTVITKADSVLLTGLGSCRWLYYNVYGVKITETNDTLMCRGYIYNNNNSSFCNTCKSVYPAGITYKYNETFDTMLFSWNDIEGVTWYVSDNYTDTIQLDTPFYAQALICNTSRNIHIVGDTTGTVEWCKDYQQNSTKRSCYTVPYTKYRDLPSTYYYSESTYGNYTGHSYYGYLNIHNQFKTFYKNIQESIGVKSVGADSICVVWEKSSKIEDTITEKYVISWRKADDYSATPMYDTVAYSDSVYTIRNLESNTEYYIQIEMLCPYCKAVKSRTVATTLGTCMDFTDLLSTKTFLTWGDYDNPHGGFLDSVHAKLYYYRINSDNNEWFAFEEDDRHKVFRNVNQKDNLTGSQLYCVPPGEKASVRLGNSSVGREAESISYEYFVDSTDKDMLVLKYAVVMQDPGHTKLNQPRFTLEILDSTNTVIDTACCFADFYAAGDLGWNEVASSSPKRIWKDWTTIGIDIAPYHGQTIRVRLTTYDCDEGAHYGYAYFNIKCDNKRLYIVDRCDAEDSVWLQAPLGFDYYWHQVGKTDTLSKQFEVKVPVDDNIYECVASFVGKPDCYFTISTLPVHVKPVAKASYTVDTCSNSVTLFNECYLDFDSTLGAYTKQFVDSTFWLVDNDTDIVYSDSLTLEYTENGTHTVKLVSVLSESKCTDTLTIPLNIDFIIPAELKGKDIICQGDKDTLSVAIDNTFPHNVNYLWSTGQTSSAITVQPDEDTEYSVNLYLAAGCGGVLKKQVTVNPSYNYTVFDTIVQGSVYDKHNFNQSSTGVYTQSLLTDKGCDSVVTLDLLVIPVYDTVIYADICEGTEFHYRQFSYNQQGVYVDTAKFGLYDSVFTFHITVHPVQLYDSTFYSCVGDTVDFFGTDIFRSGTYIKILQTDKGCDSSIIMDAYFNYITTSTLEVDICPEHPFVFNDIVIEKEGIYFDTLQTPMGCDSIIHITAAMYDNKTADVSAQICEGDNFDFNGRIISSPGTYTDTLQTIHGCDSVITMTLNVNPTIHNYNKVTVCEG